MRGGTIAAICRLCLVLGTFGLSACGDIFGGDDGGGGGGGPTGPIGAECDSAADCRPGLVCSARVCSASGAVPLGGACALTADCSAEGYCQAVVTSTGSIGGVCVAAGDGALEEPCSSDADCTKGLYCEIFGFSGTCKQAGTGDVGTACTAPSNCLAGLSCSAQNVCAQSPVPAGVVLFEGGQCPEPGIASGDTFHAIFEVPRATPSSDFYGLPFPNDIRIQGTLDLSGHPHPELDVVGNVTKQIIDAIGADVTAFGPHHTVYFRFNAFPDANTISVGGDSPALALVNVEADSPEYRRRLSLSWSATDGRGKFICHNWLGVRPFWNQPFAPNTTYAAFLTTSLRGPAGETPTQPTDLVAVLGESEPSDPVLAEAWEAYAPFRQFLDDEGIPATSIANAAVFTVGDPTAPMAGLRAAVEGAGAPEAGDLVLCDEGVTSPCDDGLTGEEHHAGCVAANSAYYEIHTTVAIPIYQAGAAPYLTDGGEIVFDGNGEAVEQRTEDVCVAITIPRDAEAPEAGWPVVVHAHGSGGNFQTLANSYGADLAGIGYASIGFEGVQHGNRRGGSQLDPETLFFNYANPRGVLGSIMQGAADVMAVGRFAAAFDVAAGDSPTDEGINFDDARVVFFGHSQGAIVGPPGLAADDVYGAAIISGGGGGLLLSLLEKSSPIDIASGIEAILNDGGLSEFHPLLNLIQLYFEPVDTLNYGAGLLTSRPEGMPPLHVMVTYGLGDTYTPNATTRELANRMSLPVLTPVVDDFQRPTVTPPVSGNLTIGASTVTGVLAQYEPPAGRDGHFVAFDVEAARTQILGFLESYAATGVPTIPTP